jgi:hypothetical protein
MKNKNYAAAKPVQLKRPIKFDDAMRVPPPPTGEAESLAEKSIAAH